MTATDSLPAPLAAFRGPVACSLTGNALTLSGAAADCADDRLIVTFIGQLIADVPGLLEGASIRAVDQRHYLIASESQELLVEAAAFHLHRDIGSAFYRAIPPRPAPLTKRIFWRVVLALAGSPAGKRLLLSLRRQA